MIKISLKKTIEEVEIPSFGSELSSGFDVKQCLEVDAISS